MDQVDVPDIRRLTGHSTSTTSVVTAAGLGKRRAWSDFSKLEWAYLVLSLVNILATVSLTIYRLVVVIEQNQTASADFTLSILIFVNAGFCIYYIFSSLLFEMKHEVFVFLVAIFVVVIYCTIDYATNSARRTTVKLVRLIAAWALGVLNITLGVPVALRFRWLEFRIVGPNEVLQRMYREALWFICLVIFDFQVSYSIVVLVLRNGAELEHKVYEIVILVVGFIFCPLYALLGWFTVRHESTKLSWLFAFLGFVTPAYVIYKIVEIALTFSSKTDARTTLDIIAVAACGLSLVVRGLTFFGLFRVTRNFGKGLKVKITTDGQDQQAPYIIPNQQTPPVFAGDT